MPTVASDEREREYENLQAKFRRSGRYKGREKESGRAHREQAMGHYGERSRPRKKRKGGVPGAVIARVLSSGRTEPLPLPMREIVENSGVSYMGTFGFKPGEYVEVHIRASPKGSSETAEFEFRERMSTQ